MSKVLVNESSLTGIANAIRGKNGSTDTYKPSEMAAAITAISGGGGGGPEIPDEAFVLSGSLSYWDYNGKWDKFIETYINKWSTSNIVDTSNMFYGCELAQIPFEINLGNYPVLANMFKASKITTLPQINGSNISVQSMSGFLSDSKIQNIPNDYFNFIGDIYDSYSDFKSLFYCCYKLRNFPSSASVIMTKYKSTSYIYNPYYNLFYFCYVLDEVTNLGVITIPTITRNYFFDSFFYCHRLKNITFESGKTVNWKNQTIDLSYYVGYSNRYENITNNGITADKQVTDDATYQALKDDPDWWTANIAYSRYNHDSAVATINSLPDTSAYLAANGGTNTIKFKGESGSATDGGAISSLTPEEIAVATSRGWTVSFV